MDEYPDNRSKGLPALADLPWWAYGLFLAIAVIGTLVGHYLNPVMFPLVATFVAVLVYLVVLYSTGRAFAMVCGESDSNFLCGDVVGSFLLVAAGFVAGCAGGVAWWTIASPDWTSMSESVLAAGFLGCLPVLILLGGW